MTVSGQKTANSLLWSGIESGSLAVISLGSLIAYSRLLSQSEFGLFSVVFAMTDLLGILVTMTFHDALVQRRDVTALHFDTAFSVTMVISLLLMALCWIAGPGFLRVVQQPGADQVLAWMGLMFPCLGLSATIVARQRREFAFKSLAMRSLVGRVLGGVAGVSMAFMGAGVWSLVVQQVVTALVGSLTLWITSDERPRLRFGAGAFWELTVFGVFSIGSLFLSFSIKRLFTIFAGILLGVATAGYLNLSFRVVDVLWAVSATAVSQVALPMLAGLQSDPARVQRAYKTAVEFACLALYPCFVGIAITAPDIIDIVFGHRWAAATSGVTALACLVLAQAPRLFATPALTAIGRPRDALVGIIVELVFMLSVIACLGLPSLGWAIGVWVASECIQIPVSAWMLYKATGYGFGDQFSGVRTPLVAVAAMALALLLTRSALPPGLSAPEHMACLVLVGACVYAGSIALLDRRLISAFTTFVRLAFAKARA